MTIDLAGMPHWLIITAAVLTACGVIWRKAIRPVVNGVKRITTAVEYVESELRFNGGTTTRDAIRRIEEHLGIDPAPRRNDP